VGAIRARRWATEANPGQTPPSGSWRTWYAQGGRGSGKTRAGAEALADAVLRAEPGDWACVGPTFGDARDTMVEHRKSGLLKVFGPNVVNWNRSNGELYIANGSTIFCDGAVEGAERIQGKGLRGAWCDEIGLWRVTKTRKGDEKGGTQAWQESIEFAVREAPAIIIATGTPKGKKGVVKLLMEEPEGRVAFSFPRLADNVTNLDQRTYEGWVNRWGGTRLGKQELEGQVLEDVEGALWTLDLIEADRSPVIEIPANQRGRIVVAIDPPGTVTGDEAGIIAAGLVNPEVDLAHELGFQSTINLQHALVYADRSGQYTPDGWARAAIDLYHELEADRIVVERNNGGEMVTHVIRSIDPNVPITTVWASQGKATRAEPIAGVYEQHRIHHLGVHEELEAEMVTWVPGEPSPNRMDALVWAIQDLMVDKPAEYRIEGGPEEIIESLTADLFDKRW
jgi:phage terminase large subunit-like protein